jgi:hypothetical protein
LSFSIMEITFGSLIGSTGNSTTYAACLGTTNWPSLRQKGYSESLVAAAGGPLNEIADLVVGTVTRWAACRCGEARGMDIFGSAELTRACRAILPLFPTTESTPHRWTGWSFVVFKEERTKGRRLGSSLDGWLRGLSGGDA